MKECLDGIDLEPDDSDPKKDEWLADRKNRRINHRVSEDCRGPFNRVYYFSLFEDAIFPC